MSTEINVNEAAPIPSVERLDAMAATLKASDRLDAGTRAELIALLGSLAFRQVVQGLTRRGAKTSDMQLCAEIVHELHWRHGVRVKSAAMAMVKADVGPAEASKQRQNIERAYRSFKANGRTPTVSDWLVLAVLEQINPSHRK
jgi:hypothetical protein